MAVVETPTITWPLPTSFEPRPYQLDALQRIIERRFQVLDHGLGAGKTTTALAALEAVGAMRVLVLCPDKVKRVWADEVDENAQRDWVVWAGEVQGARGPLKNPSVARRCESIIQANSGAIRIRHPFLAVINYESLSAKPMQQLLLGTHWDAIVLDEGHKLAAAAGVWSKFVAKLTKFCRQRRGRVIETTGTFMPHSGLSVFGQMRAVNPDVLGWTVTPFRARYASHKVIRQQNTCPVCYRVANLPVGHGCPVLCNDPETGRIALLQEGEPIYMSAAPKPDGSRIAVDYKIPGKQDDRIPEGVHPDRHQELMDRIAPWVHRVSQAELDAITGLVETPPQIRTCTLRPPTRKVYDALERNLIAQLDDGTITAANAMVNVLRLAQVTSGYGVDSEDGRTIALTPGMPEKAKLLADELEDLDVREPVVIFARFHHDLDQIARVCETQGRRYAEISGRRADGLDGHVMASNCDVVGVQPQAGGAGISLTRAALCVFYTSDWSLANYDQAKRRVLRQGQTRHVTYLHLVAEDTVDVSLFYALKRRRETNDAVLARLKGTSQ